MVLTKKQKVSKLIKLAFKAVGIMTIVCVGMLILTWWLFPFPIERLDKWPVSPTVLDSHGRSLLSIVGSDEQWRYPIRLDQMSPWLKRATIAVEDEHFYRHIGVDPIAVIRAAGQNIAARRIVSGASTLNMQLCRMMDDRPRTLKAKMIESFRALQLNKLNRSLGRTLPWHRTNSLHRRRSSGASTGRTVQPTRTKNIYRASISYTDPSL